MKTEDGNEKTVFTKSGDQLNEWKIAEFNITSTQSYQVCKSNYQVKNQSRWL